MNILITGASGYIGGHIGRSLKGHKIYALSRDNNTKMDFPAEVLAMEDLSKIKDLEVIINLAGASIAGQRWTAEYKKTIYSSRVDLTRELLSRVDTGKLKTFIQASAVGAYKTGKDKITEESPLKEDDFLAKVVRDWEQVSVSLGCRRCLLRFGAVLGKGSPVLKKMLPLFNKNLGAVLGSGEQYIPWIYIEDLVKVVLQSLEDKNFSGVYNVVSPKPVTNKEFTSALTEALDKIVLLPAAPKFSLKLMYGEMSQVLLDSHRCIPKRLKEEHQFSFDYKDISSALKASTT